VAEATESKSKDLLEGKTPEAGHLEGDDESGESALDGFVKDAHSWFEEEVLQAKLDKEKEAEEARRRAEEAAKAAEEAKAKAEADLKAQLEKERHAREQAEAEAKKVAEAEKAKEKEVRDKAEAKPAPAAAAAPAEAVPAAPASKNGIYFLIGSAIIGVAVVILALQLGRGDEKANEKPAAGEGGMAVAAMTEPMDTEPMRAEPMRAEPVRTEPVRTEPIRPRPDTPRIGGLQCVDKKVYVGRIQVGPEQKLDASKPLHARCGKGKQVCKARACFAKAEDTPDKTVLSAEIIEPADLAASKTFAKSTCQQDLTAGTVICERPQRGEAPFVRFDTRPAPAAPGPAEPGMTGSGMRPARVPARRRIRRPGRRPRYVPRRRRRRYYPRRRRPMRRRGMGMGWENPFG
jgi:hypothetical protein